MQMNDHLISLRRYNRSNHVREEFNHRCNMINNVADYRTGERIHECLTIQVLDIYTWNRLFCGCVENNYVNTYAHEMIRNTNGFDVLQVSMMIERHISPNVHCAVFIIHAIPHKHLCRGHIVDFDFGEGSLMHQTLNQLFNVDTAIVEQFYEKDLLAFLADESEMNRMLFGYFMSGFNFMRYNNPNAQLHMCSFVTNIVMLDEGENDIINNDIINNDIIEENNGINDYGINENDIYNNIIPMEPQHRG